MGGLLKVPREKAAPQEKFEPLESGLKIVKLDSNGKLKVIGGAGLQIVQSINQ